MLRRSLLLAAVLASLAGCDQLGIESATATAGRIEADGKAVGAACRHGGRAIEDCFTLNRKTDKAAIYAGWREMDDYMRENKMEAVAPVLGPDKAKTADADADGAAASETPPVKAAKADKPAEKPVDKVGKGDKPAEKIAKLDKPVVKPPRPGEKPTDKPTDKTAPVEPDKSAAAH